MTKMLDLDLPRMSVINKDLSIDTLPPANYSKLSERLRKSAPSDLQCIMFCGGRKCKYECPNWTPQDMALPGIFSHWVTDNILAMARPNTETIRKYRVVEYFRRHGIRSIINLQEPGEHANCGNALNASGFSYDPTFFMKHDVYFYNFQWKDYSIVSEEALLDMVKVMTFALTEGKVAIHCHAGLGRTGVLIAAFIIFTCRSKPQDTILYVRSKRPQSIQTRGQIFSVLKFAQLVLPMFVVFPHIIHRQQELTLSQFLDRQRHLLHGYELRHLRHIPKIIYVICERLLHLCGIRSFDSDGGLASKSTINNSENPVNYRLDNSESICKYFLSTVTSGSDMFRDERPASSIQFSSENSTPEMSPFSRLNVSLLKSNAADTSKSRIQSEDDLFIASSASNYNGVSKESHHNQNDNNKNSLFYNDNYFSNTPLQQINSVGLETPKKSSKDNLIEQDNDDLDEDLFNEGAYTFFEDTSNQMEDLTNYENDDMVRDESSENDFLNESDGHAIGDVRRASFGLGSVTCIDSTDKDGQEVVDRTTVFRAFTINYSSLGQTFILAFFKHQKELNSRQSGWEKLEKESSVEMLCALLWSWLENLKEPVLNKNSLCSIILKAEKPIEALIKLDQNTRYTVEYLIRFLARLQPDEDTQDTLIRHLMALLTKQCLRDKNERIVPSYKEDWPSMKKGTADRVMLFANGIYQLVVE